MYLSLPKMKRNEPLSFFIPHVSLKTYPYGLACSLSSKKKKIFSREIYRRIYASKVPIYVQLNMQDRGLPVKQNGLVRLKRVLHLGRGELLHLLGSAADKSARVKEGIELGQNGAEELGATDTFEQVVVLSVLLDVVGGLVGEDTCDLLVILT